MYKNSIGNVPEKYAMKGSFKDSYTYYEQEHWEKLNCSYIEDCVIWTQQSGCYWLESEGRNIKDKTFTQYDFFYFSHSWRASHTFSLKGYELLDSRASSSISASVSYCSNQ